MLSKSWASCLVLSSLPRLSPADTQYHVCVQATAASICCLAFTWVGVVMHESFPFSGSVRPLRYCMQFGHCVGNRGACSMRHFTIVFYGGCVTVVILGRFLVGDCYGLVHHPCTSWEGREQADLFSAAVREWIKIVKPYTSTTSAQNQAFQSWSNRIRSTRLVSIRFSVAFSEMGSRRYCCAIGKKQCIV